MEQRKDLDEDLDRHLNLNTSSPNNNPNAASDQNDVRSALEAEERKSANLLATLDDAVLKNNELTRDLETLEAHVKDAELLYQARLLESDLKLTQAEADLAALQLNQKSLEEEAREASALRESVKTLTEWHADLTAQLLLCDAQLKQKQTLLERSEASRNELDTLAVEYRGLCTVLEESQALSDQLITAFVDLEKHLRADNEELRGEVAALKQALRDSVTKLTTEKAEIAQQLATVTNAQKALENRLKELEPQILSKWDVIFNKRVAAGTPSPTTWDLCMVVQKAMGRLQADFSAGMALLANSWELESSRNAAPVLSSFKLLTHFAQLQRLLTLPPILAEYILHEDLAHWAVILKENRKTLRKDKSPIQWVMQATKDFSDMMFWMEELCSWCMETLFPIEHLMEIDVTVTENGTRQSLASLVEPAVECVTLVIEACVAERLSEAISTRSCALLSTAVKRFLDEKGQTLDDFPKRQSMSTGLLRLMYVRMLAYHFALCTDEDLFQDAGPRLELVIRQNVASLFDALQQRQPVEWLFLRVNKDGDMMLLVQAEQNVEATFKLMTRTLRRVALLAMFEDPTEYWTLTQLVVAKETLSTPTAAPLRDRSVDSLVEEVQELVSAFNSVDVKEETLMMVETVRFAQKQATTTRGASVDMEMPAAAASKTLDRRASVRESTAVKEELAITKLQLEQLRQRESEFAAAEKNRRRLNDQIARDASRLSTLENENERLKKEVEKWKALHAVAERERREALDTRMSRVLAPPSVAALELLKVKAAAARMERELLDLSMRNASQDWHKLQTVYKLPPLGQTKRHEGQNEIAKTLALRRQIIMLSTKNNAVEGMIAALEKGQDIKKPGSSLLSDLLSRQVATHRELLKLKSEMRELASPELRAKASILPALNPFTVTSEEPTLVMKIPTGQEEMYPRVLANRRDLQDLMTTIF